MPNLDNRTGFSASLVPLISPEGRNTGVVLVKATYQIATDFSLVLAAEQDALLMTDCHLGDPANTAILLPSDLALEKPVTELLVIQPLRPDLLNAYMGKTLGIEFAGLQVRAKVATPWLLGPVRRDAPDRLAYAGTYDQAWQDERMPLLPIDFDARYWMSAPSGQWCSHVVSGDETLVLTQFHGVPQMTIRLPGKASRYVFWPWWSCIKRAPGKNRKCQSKSKIKKSGRKIEKSPLNYCVKLPDRKKLDSTATNTITSGCMRESVFCALRICFLVVEIWF